MEISAETVSKVCRLCLKPEKRMRSTFEKIIDKLHIPKATFLSDLIMSCANVQICKNDGLPQNICLECVKNLHKMILFRKQVESNDTHLRNILQIEDVSNDSVQNVNVEIMDHRYWENFDIHYKYNGHQVVKCNKGEIFNCNVCHADFIEYEEFMKHQTCFDHCENKITTNENLTEDLDQQDHSHNKFYCLCCDTLQFANRKMLSRHILSQHMRTKRCRKCRKKFKSFSKFYDHLLLFSRKNRCVKEKLPCKRCGKVFYSSIRLLAHQLGHEWESDKTCKLCKMNIKRKSNIIRHIEEHIQGKCETSLCRKCNKNYSNLRAHTFVHDLKSRHKCDICGDTFAFFTSLKFHVDEHI